MSPTRPVITAALLLLSFEASARAAPSSQQGAKLVGAGAVGQSHQGTSVALSADGSTAIVGGPYDNLSYEGAVWVYTRSAGVWSQQGGKLGGTGAEEAASQGYSVALSADGNTALEGGPQDDGGAGAAWAFTRSAGVWSQQGPKLVGTGVVASQALQGVSVALSADGNTAIVGGYGDNNSAGAAWVYARSGGVWSQQGGKLIGTGAGGNASQGWSVALSADGNTAIVGGYGDNGGAGAAWVFTRSAGVWAQQGVKLVGTGAVGTAQQGRSVALSGDGSTAIVGGLMDNGATGAAWVYTRSAQVWSQHGSKLAGTDAAAPSYQGRSVGLSGDGRTAIVGGAADDNNVGAAWVFVDPAVLAAMPPRALSSALRLAPPFPNPTTDKAVIAFSLPRDADVMLGVYDVAGRCVKTLVAGPTPAGDHTIRWDGRTSAGRPAPDGLYLLDLRADGDQLTRPLVVLR